MKRHIDYKVLGGKLLRVDIDIENGLIKEIRITGDFFIHPEEGIKLIEESLKGVPRKRVRETLKKVVGSNGIRIIGFGADDLENLLSQA